MYNSATRKLLAMGPGAEVCLGDAEGTRAPLHAWPQERGDAQLAPGQEMAAHRHSSVRGATPVVGL